MRNFEAALMLAAALAAGAAAQEGRPAKPGARRPADAAKVKPEPATLPPNAEKIGESTWRARDAEGRAWIYRRTPFGLSREREGEAAKESRRPAGIRVVGADGASAVFERQTPFGAKRWTKSLEELSAGEKQALEDWRKAGRQ